MSASLVGSEMCIRDRGTPARWGPGRLRARARGARGAGRRSCAEAARRAAVSYTHLTLPTICSV
eukprot:4320429-Alexandrium_andersonii.AAC.1